MAGTLVDAKAKIYKFEAMLLQMPQAHTPVTHEFCDGIYARTMFIPKGVALTGAIHSNENFLIIRTGDITVWTEAGMKRLRTGELIFSKAGIKRVGYAHEDTLLTTFHANPTNEKNPELLWELFTVPDESYLEHEITLLLEA